MPLDVDALSSLGLGTSLGAPSPEADAAYTASALAFHAAGGNVLNSELGAELGQIALASGEVRAKGMRFHAGHALNYVNVSRIAILPGIRELHIGHAIVARAVWVGLRQAVADMKATIERARNDGGS